MTYLHLASISSASVDCHNFSVAGKSHQTWSWGRMYPSSQYCVGCNWYASMSRAVGCGLSHLQSAVTIWRFVHSCLDSGSLTPFWSGSLRVSTWLFRADPPCRYRAGKSLACVHPCRDVPRVW